MHHEVCPSPSSMRQSHRCSPASQGGRNKTIHPVTHAATFWLLSLSNKTSQVYGRQLSRKPTLNLQVKEFRLGKRGVVGLASSIISPGVRVKEKGEGWRASGSFFFPFSVMNRNRNRNNESWFKGWSWVLGQAWVLCENDDGTEHPIHGGYKLC